MPTKKTTLVRIERNTLHQMKIDHPDMTAAEIIKMYKDTYNGLQRAGKLIYGKFWKR